MDAYWQFDDQYVALLSYISPDSDPEWSKRLLKPVLVNDWQYVNIDWFTKEFIVLTDSTIILQ
jgi:hypothetical protein